VRTPKPTPYTFTVRDIVRRPGEMREHHVTVALAEPWGEGLLAVPAGAELDLDVRFESVHEGIWISGTAETEAVGECGRCLTDMAESVEVEFGELFAYPGDEAADFEVHDDHVDLEPLVRDAIVLSLPFQPVCQPDCPGLDSVTGERLTTPREDTAETSIDPRWAALQELTDHGGEATRSATQHTEEG